MSSAPSASTRRSPRCPPDADPRRPPQANGHVERLHRTILEECWRPAFARFHFPGYTGLYRHLDSYITYYNYHRAHTGRTTAGRTPAEVIYGARKKEPR